MQRLRHWFEKPSFIWILIGLAYIGLYFGVYQHKEFTDQEKNIHPIIRDFANSTFPPKIILVKELKDFSHSGYYILMGAICKITKGKITENINHLRLVGTFFVLIGLFFFVLLGHHYSRNHRLNPMWISFGLLIFAFNPYLIYAAMTLGYIGILIAFLLGALYFFEKEDYRDCSIFITTAVLVDWRALLLAIVFVIVRMKNDESKIIYPDRVFFLSIPFILAIAQILSWKGFVPRGEIRDIWHGMREQISLFHINSFFYVLVLLPIYSLFFSWTWGMRARVRAVKTGLIVSALLIPLYFVFPISFDPWNQIKFHLDIPLGFIDEGALKIAGEYKNILMVIPFFAGAFLFLQFIQRQIDDQSRGLWWFIVLFFFIQPFMLGLGADSSAGPNSAYGDLGFLIVLPFIILYTISEAMVGEEGNLST